LATALNVQPATLRSQLANNNDLVAVPLLHYWLVDLGVLPPTASPDKPRFILSSTWTRIIKQTQNKIKQSEHESQYQDNIIQEHMVEENETSESSDSSSDSSSDNNYVELPANTPRWIMTEPRIPDQFSKDDYSKSYALKPYDIPKTLKKELKKMRKWWTKKRNAERHGEAVHEHTMDKREEQALCFLGFVNRYKCLSEDLTMTLSLYLNHRLVQSYLEYLTQVRGSSDGTIGEALTGAISVCRWLYRKEKQQMKRHPQIIRRYMDYRNTYQASAMRTRSQNDVDELQEQNRWIEWSDFTALILKLRSEWNDIQDEADDDDDDDDIKTKTIEQAHIIHDLLLLGLYSCIPGRGAEVRLLEYVSADELKTKMNAKFNKISTVRVH
jgi:hypothetical protein